jgi:hypothetical protein
MNVTLSEIEAKYIEAEKGIKAEQLSGSRRHDQNQFIGIPCPFLKEDVCSIYDVRPFACRKHLSFDTSPYWCEPERAQEVEMPLVKFEGAENALMMIAKANIGGVFADIRDFFPN